MAQQLRAGGSITIDPKRKTRAETQDGRKAAPPRPAKTEAKTGAKPPAGAGKTDAAPSSPAKEG